MLRKIIEKNIFPSILIVCKNKISKLKTIANRTHGLLIVPIIRIATHILKILYTR
jgi:hypothetical protein